VLLILPVLCRATELTGSVLDDQGIAIFGAIVTVARSSVDGPLPASESYTTTTAADGSYSVKDLTAGPFVVCAVAPGRSLLDPCEWSSSQTVVRLPGGTGTVSATTQLQLGATVSIRVDDPALALTATVVAGSPHPFLSMGVWASDGHFHQAWRVSSDSTGYNYTLVIPPNVDLAFAVNALNLTVTDNTKTTVDPNQRANVNLAAGGTLQLQYSATAIATAIP
jgi:hypothetical protein